MSHRLRRLVGAGGSLALALGLISLIGAPAPAGATPSYAVKGKRVSMSMTQAIKSLPVSGETPRGYTRSKFKAWTDQDHDGRNTRAEVLQAESKTKVTGRTTIKTGTWRDWYTAQTFYRASELDIDHMVPLKEAWSSGAKSWSAARREAYANDLAEPNTLVAVSLHANRAKGDREPRQWMPPHNKTRYAKAWVTVKVRWSLRVDGAEKDQLLTWARQAGDPRITTTKASVKDTPSTGAAKKSGTAKKSGGSTSSLDPWFPTATAAKAAGYGPYYRGKDPEYAWYIDRDNDGVAVE